MRVLVIGLGSIARKHIAALRNIDPEAEILALRSSIGAPSCDGVRDIYDISAIKGTKIDFAIISTPTSEHLRSLVAARELDCPLFIEKPVHHTLECESVVRELMSSGVLTYVACNLRFLDSLRFIKNAVETRGVAVNEVNAYCGSYLPEWRKDVDFRKVYSSVPEMGGGVNIDLIHEIDYLYWIFGIPESVVKVLRNGSSLGIRAVDYANYTMDYGNFCASVVLNYYRRDYKRTLEIVWEDETWLCDLARNMVVRTSDGQVLFRSDDSILDTYEAQLRYFADLVRNNKKESFNTVGDALSVLKICLDDESER